MDGSSPTPEPELAWAGAGASISFRKQGPLWVLTFRRKFCSTGPYAWPRMANMR